MVEASSGVEVAAMTTSLERLTSGFLVEALRCTMGTVTEKEMPTSAKALRNGTCSPDVQRSWGTGTCQHTTRHGVRRARPEMRTGRGGREWQE